MRRLIITLFFLAFAVPAHAVVYGGTINLPTTRSILPVPLNDVVTDFRNILGSVVGTTPGPAGFVITLSVAGQANAPSDAAGLLSGQGVDAFLIRGTSSTLDISASSEYGIINGVYWYLDNRLGVRFLGPGDNWTVIPVLADISTVIDAVKKPVIVKRVIAGTGGFFSWRWGRSYSGSTVKETQYFKWGRALLYGGQNITGKATGETFNTDPLIKPIIAANPSYLAKINGVYTPQYLPTGAINVTAKLNAGNPSAVTLYCNWVRDRFVKDRNAFLAGTNPTFAGVASVEPADGLGYGNNFAELPGNGSSEDQTYYIANQCAIQLNTEFPGSSVVLLAYSGHSLRPSFALETNVIIQVTPYSYQTEDPIVFIEAWKAKATRLTLYDYWSIPDFVHDEPSFNYIGLKEKLAYWNTSKIEGISSETTFSAGAMGLGHYIASKLMWDLTLSDTTILDDWYTKAFGSSAKVPMKRMVERWSRTWHPTSDEIGQSFLDVSQALALVTVGSPEYLRICDYALYVQYLRLRVEIRNKVLVADKTPIVMAMAKHVLGMNQSAMIHTTRIIDLDTRPYPTVWAEYSLSSNTLNPQPGPGWATLVPLTPSDAVALVNQGLIDFPAPTWAPNVYTGSLVPVVEQTPLPIFSAGFGPTMDTIAAFDADIYMTSALLETHVCVEAPVAYDITVSSPTGAILLSAHRDAGLPAFDHVSAVSTAGPYKLHIQPVGARQSGYFRFSTALANPLVLHNFLAIKGKISPKVYFWVPTGVTKVILWVPYGVYLTIVPKFAILNPNGVTVTPTYRDGLRVLEIPVAAGLSGKAWSLINIVSPDFPIELLNIPNSFSYAIRDLRVPSDAL